MAQPSSEPSMEDILASIKRIIAEDSDGAPPRGTPRPRRGPVAVPDPEPASVADTPDDEDRTLPPAAHSAFAGIAELHEADIAAPPPPSPPPPPAEDHADVLELTSPLPEDRGGEREAILSDTAEQASRNAFAALGRVTVRAEPARDATTLEGLVADLLRPMLRDYLDRELPGIVERLVKAEIARVSGRG